MAFYLLKRFFFRNKIIKIRIKDYPQPLYLRNDTSDITVFYQIFLEKSYALDYRIDPRIIIDCGANIGLSCVFYNLKFPGAKIIALEPEKSNFQLLVKNTRAIPHIINLNAGIWNKSTNLMIENCFSSKWEIQVKKISKTKILKVRGISIPDLMHHYNFNNIDILKIDIEGSEKELFEKNFESWLPLIKVLVIELHDNIRKGASKSFFTALSNYNYQMAKKRENLIFYMG